MKFVVSLLLSAMPLLATASVISLNDANFDSATSGKDLVFVKFFAPWCGHCKSMAKDWEELATSMAQEKPDLLIAEVDCTNDETEGICSENNIEGFPTLMYGEPDFLESYDGAREYDEMYSFATTQIKATCSPKNLDLCDDGQKAKLNELMSMSVMELEQSIEKLDALEEQMNSDFDESTDALEEDYLAMVAVNEKAKKEAKASVAYDSMKSILIQKTKTDGNDEL